jgi:hypothetical protein
MMCRMTAAASRIARTALRPAAAIVAALVATGAVTGCSWRAETPPIERRTPTPEVAMRDAAAVREQAVLDAAGSGLLKESTARTAAAHLEALGGVYVATPSPSPEWSATASEPVPHALEDAVEAAIEGALDAASTAAASDPSLTALLRSIALSHAVALDAPAAAGEAPAARPMPGTSTDSLVPAEGTAVPAATLAALAVDHDRAAFALEVGAARAEEDERLAALELAALHRARAADLIALDGVDDARAELYAVSPDSVASPASRAALALAIEIDLAERYARLLGDATADDADWILNASYDAYVRAASLPGFAATDVPALPGLELAD